MNRKVLIPIALVMFFMGFAVGLSSLPVTQGKKKNTGRTIFKFPPLTAPKDISIPKVSPTESLSPIKDSVVEPAVESQVERVVEKLLLPKKSQPILITKKTEIPKIDPELNMCEYKVEVEKYIAPTIRELNWRGYLLGGYGQKGVKISVSPSNFELVEQYGTLIGFGLSRKVYGNYSIGAFAVDTETYGAMIGYDYGDFRFNGLIAYGVNGTVLKNNGSYISAEAQKGLIPGFTLDYNFTDRWGGTVWLHGGRSAGVGVVYNFNLF